MNELLNSNLDSEYVDYKNDFEAEKAAEKRKINPYDQQEIQQSKINNAKTAANNKVLHNSLNQPINNQNRSINNQNINASALKNKINNGKNKKSSNSQMTNKLASAGLTAAGVPKGMSDAIVNSKMGQKAIETLKKKNPMLNAFDKLTGGSKNEQEDEHPEAEVSVKIPPKVLNVLLAVIPSVMMFLVFCILIVAGTQTYINVIGLDTANKSSEEINNDIENSSDEERNEEITDENITAYSIIIEKKEYAIPYLLVNANNEEEKTDNKLNLSDLKDYYGSNSDIETIHKFYLKLQDIYDRYLLKLNVALDLPLIMSTLMMQSKDMNVVFTSNTSESYDRTNIETVESHVLDYDHDWSGYRISSKSSAHDIEILAQNMISLDASGKYYVDYDKYDEFLKEFLEKKYFINDGGVYNGKPGVIVDNSNQTVQDGNYVEGIEYANSSFGSIIYFNQGDYKKYYYSSDPSKAQYGNATISSHGCGPTSLAIVVSSFLNKQITPIETTSKVCKAKGCTTSGSKYQALIDVGKDYGLKVTTTKKDQDVINALNTNNSLVIVLMGPGTFTSGGHFIVLTGVNENGKVSVADPGSRKRTETKWFSFNTVVEQRKTYAPYMIFSR